MTSLQKGRFYREDAKDTKAFKNQVSHLHLFPQDVIFLCENIKILRALRFFAVKVWFFQWILEFTRTGRSNPCAKRMCKFVAKNFLCRMHAAQSTQQPLKTGEPRFFMSNDRETDVQSTTDPIRGRVPQLPSVFGPAVCRRFSGCAP